MPNVEDSFRFSLGDVVLVDWEDKLYYAKILNICASKSTCRLLFDDGSSGSAHFNQIHNGRLIRNVRNIVIVIYLSLQLYYIQYSKDCTKVGKFKIYQL